MQKNVMSVQETADYLGFSDAKVYKLIEAKKIPASRVGRQYRFLKDVLDMWLTRNIISEDGEFLTLIRETRKDFLSAGYTQEDIAKSLEKNSENTQSSN